MRVFRITRPSLGYVDMWEEDNDHAFEDALYVARAFTKAGTATVLSVFEHAGDVDLNTGEVVAEEPEAPDDSVVLTGYERTLIAVAIGTTYPDYTSNPDFVRLIDKLDGN